MHHSFLSQTSHTFGGALGARMGFIKRRFTFKDKLVTNTYECSHTTPHNVISDCYLIMKCKEQPPLVGVCIHCMDYWTGLTFELTFELSFFLSMINIAVV